MANTWTAGTHTFALDTATTVAGLTTLKGSPCASTDHITGGDHLTVESDIACASIDLMPTITTGTLVVGTPGAGLCALADVQTALNVGAGIDEEVAEALIASASAILRERESITVPRVTEERAVPFVDGPTIYPHELASVTKVEDADGNELTYSVATVRGMVLWIELSAPYAGPVTITGTWGYSTVPEKYVRACAVTVANWYLRATADEKGFLGNLSALPKDALDILGKPVRV